VRRAILRSILAAGLAAGLAAALAVPAVTPAAAQPADDWEVKHDPFDLKVVGRYKAILAKNPSDSGALAKLLAMYRRYRSVAQLEKEYQAQLDKKPTDFATLVVLGHLRKTAGDEAGALGFYEKAAAQKKDDPGLLVELGGLYRNAGKTAEARTTYEKALAASKGKDVQKKALRALADLAIAANDIDGAKKYFEKYLALDPKNGQLRVELGDALLQAGKHDDAIATYREAEKGLAGDASRKLEVVMRIGQALEAKGADDAAVAEYRRALKLAGKGHFIENEVTARIVDLYRRKQDLPALLAFYEKEWPARSRGHFEWSTLAQLYEETGAGEKAIDAYKKAVAKSPWELETQRRLIQMLENVGREDEAIKQYEAVVRVAPSEPRFQLELAERYERRGNLKKALATLKRLEGSFPGDPGVQSALADLYQRWGKEDLALAAYERLAKLEPNDPSHLVVLGEQHWQKGDKASRDRALAIWKRIANQKTAAAYAKLGDVLAEHQMPVDALAHYAKAIKLEPKNPELYKGRAAIYEGQKQLQEAMADWEAAMALLGTKPADRTARREARRHIVSLLTRWGGKEADYRNKWVRDFKKSPPDLEAGYFLVEYFDRRPQAGEPKATLERLRTLVPEDQDVIGDLVKAYRTAHEYDKAVALLLELEKLAPQRKREIYTQIAEIKTEDLKDDEAIAWATKAVEISNSKDPVAWERLAERYVAMQRTGDAIAAYEKALELDRRNFKAAFSLAVLYKQASRTADASALYRRVLKDATDDETLSKAGHQAIDLEEMTRSLGELEKVIAPLSFQMAHKPVYRRILVDLYLRYVPYLVSQVRHGDTAARKTARAELVRLGQHGLKPLLEALNDEKDVNQQRGAVAILGHLGNPGAAAPLVRVAKTEPKTDDPMRRIGTLQQSLDWEVRVEALVAAGRLADPRVLGEVLPLAKHDEVAMREAAVFTIGRTRDKRAVAPLIAALGDRRESVQALACVGLAQIDDGKGVNAMIEVVADGKRHDLARAACAWGLGVRRARAAVAALERALGDNRGETQRLAGWALAQIGDKKALPDVIRAYFTRDDQARPVLGWALAHLAGSAPAAPSSGELVDYPLRNGKFHTATAIADLGGDLPRATGVASVVVGNETAIADGIRAVLGEHRDSVLGMLVDLDGRDTGISLGALVPPGTKVDGKLAAALAQIGGAIAKDVATHLDDRDPKVRALALSVTAKIRGKDDQVDPLLLHALEDPASLVRQAAMRAIVTVVTVRGEAPASFRAALATAVTRADRQDRRAAARALAAAGDAPEVVDALVAALGDDDGYVRESAAQSLGALKSRRATDGLLAATRDESWEVRRAAARALVALGDPKAKERLAELASTDESPEVRAAAGGK